MHNVRVRMTHRTIRCLVRPTSVAATVTVVALLAGCGGGDGNADESPEPTPSPSPSSTVQVPEAVSLADPGSDVSFGDSASVIYEPEAGRGTVLDLAVTKATRGSLDDFSAFKLDDYTRSSTPYYVNVTVKNVGEGDVGGANIPLWGVDAQNTLLPAAMFTTGFGKCASEPLPDKFAAGASLDTCLVYLAPEKGTLEAVSFRPTQEFEPITWTGEITTPAPEPKKAEKPGKKKKRG